MSRAEGATVEDDQSFTDNRCDEHSERGSTPKGSVRNHKEDKGQYVKNKIRANTTRYKTKK